MLPGLSAYLDSEIFNSDNKLNLPVKKILPSNLSKEHHNLLDATDRVDCINMNKKLDFPDLDELHKNELISWKSKDTKGRRQNLYTKEV